MKISSMIDDSDIIILFFLILIPKRSNINLDN